MGNFADVVRRIEAIFLVGQYTFTRDNSAISKENPANRNLDFQSRNESYSSAVKQVIYFTQFKCHVL